MVTTDESWHRLTHTLNAACTTLAAHDGRDRSGLVQLYTDHEALIRAAPGSRRAHHAWSGGYCTHILEAVAFYNAAYNAVSTFDPPSFPRESGQIALALHDLEKPWLYGSNMPIESKSERQAFRLGCIAAYRIAITNEEHNAILYAEGEFDYEPGKRKMLPLAALVHAADVLSARALGSAPIPTP